MSYYTFEGLIPVVHPTAFVHPSAILIGNVIVGASVYISPLTSLHGDYRQLIMQAGANIQDGCIMHGYCNTDTIVGENSHIRHRAILHGCVIGHNALVRMNSMIMDGTVIGKESIVATMSFVKAGFSSKKHQLLMGTPAHAVHSVSDNKLHWKQLNTKEYQDLVRRYHASLHETQPLRQMEENHPHLQGTTDVTPKQ